MPTCEERDEMRRLLVAANEQMDEERQLRFNRSLLLISQAGTYPRPLDPLRGTLHGLSQQGNILRMMDKRIETGEFVPTGSQVLLVKVYDFTTLMVEEDRLFLLPPEESESEEE